MTVKTADADLTGSLIALPVDLALPTVTATPGKPYALGI